MLLPIPPTAFEGRIFMNATIFISPKDFVLNRSFGLVFLLEHFCPSYNWQAKCCSPRFSSRTFTEAHFYPK